MKIIAIAHQTENFQVKVEEGKSQAKMLEEIKQAGYTLGNKSLAALMNGSKPEAGDFKAIVEEDTKKADKKSAASKAKAAKVKADAPVSEVKADAPVSEVKADDTAPEGGDVIVPGAEVADVLVHGTDEQTDQVLDAAKQPGWPFKDGEGEVVPEDDVTNDVNEMMRQAMLPASTMRAQQGDDVERVGEPAPAPAKTQTGPKQLTPEQAALAAEVEKAMPTKEKISYRGTDWSKVLPQKPVAVRRDSKQHLLFVRLCDEKGASKQQLMDEFGWSAGGLAGIIHWEPKAKGYKLGSEKRDGVIYYHLAEIGTDRRYSAEEVLVKDRATPAAPAPKKDAAAQAPSAPAKVPVTKEQKAQVPNLGAATMVRRTAAKKSA